jgi:putative acetyltransferase
MTVAIFAASTNGDLADARTLFLEYAAGLGFSLCFQGFERELAELPGAYAPPGGTLLLARDGRELAGCVALRTLSDGAGEMKRLYVRDAFRGNGLGRRLGNEVLAAADAIGYDRVRLDTLPAMTAAIPLYRSLGFVEIPPYTDNPVAGAMFMEKALWF